MNADAVTDLLKLPDWSGPVVSVCPQGSGIIVACQNGVFDLQIRRGHGTFELTLTPLLIAGTVSH